VLNRNPNVSRRSRRLRRQTPKQQNSITLKQSVFLCEIIQLCCIPLRNLRYLRENIHMRVLNLLAQIKPPMSPADLADLRRQNTNSKTTITAIISQPSPTCLSLRDNAACCIRLRNLRENIHMRVLNQYTQKKPQCLPQISLIYADKTQTTKRL
jgi:hypothetical protein